jgi:hypothetical protein
MYGGCCHDEVLKHFQFKQFIKLIYQIVAGVPMYAVEVVF